jgi:mono/diheme cytochrome c family protein
MIQKYFLFLFFSLLFITIRGWAQAPAVGWVVPDEAKAKASPVKFTPETVKAGDAVYQKNCKACHGDPGKQNYIKLVPPPGDPASADFQKQTDGEMFFKITTGKVPMPTFGTILSDGERWQVISYIRSFNKMYVQPALATAAVPGSKNLKLRMYCNYKQKKLYVLCNEIVKDNREVPANGIDIQLNVKRYFGILKAGDPKTTDSHGMALFDFPSDIPGGKFGILEISARVKDESGKLIANTVTDKLAIGKHFQLGSLTDAHAMWSVRSKAPIWLILTFSLSIIGVWGIIFYIFLLLKKLKQAN